MRQRSGILLSNGKYTTGTAGEYIRIARKDYTCVDCDGPISIGDEYIAVANPRSYYGDLTERHHLHACPPKGGAL